MKPLFFLSIGSLAFVLFLVDRFAVWMADDPDKPTACADKDAPVVPDITWYVDKAGRIHAR